MSPTVSRGVLLKNVLANIASGASAALLSIVLPPILLRSLSRDTFAVWSLILQIGAYTGLLNFGIQVAVGRFVACHETAGQIEERDALVSTAWVSLLLAGVVAAIGMLAVAFAFPYLFPKVPAQLQMDAQVAMSWVGLSMAAGLPFSVFMGVFIGRQRHEVPGVIQVGSRFLTGIALIWTALHHGTLVSMAGAFATINFITYGLQYFIFHHYAPSYRVHFALATKAAAKELWEYCMSLSVWNVAMLLVSGLDLLIVGLIDFKAVPAYAIATSLIAFVAGLQNAVFNVLIPAGAILGAQADETSLQDLLLNATRYGVLLLLASSLPLLFGGEWLLRYYVGQDLANTTVPLLRLLLIGNFIRLTSTPYAVLLIATGQQRKVLVTPFIEGFINLGLSILLGLRIGALGVAIGTIVGAIAGSIFSYFYNFPRTKPVSVDLKIYIMDGILLPLSVCIPWVVWWWLDYIFNLSNKNNIYSIICALVISFLIVYRVLKKDEIYACKTWRMLK